MPATDNVEPLWKSLLQRSAGKDGEPKLLPTPTNVTLILANDADFRGCFARNEFSGETELVKALPRVTGMLPPRLGVVDDYALNYTQIALSLKPRELRAGDKLIAQGIESASRQQCFNPLQGRLRELRWDGVFRLDSWLSTYLGAKPSRYVASVGRWWLISAMARAFKPGCQADHVLVLEGPQGAAKSSALRLLAGADYFTDQLPDLSHKDALQHLGGMWIIELGEMDGLSRHDVTKIKAFLTVRSDRFRPSYGKFFVNQRRSCVFAGTTNSERYLRDDTGNRRFWPVRIGAIDLAALARDRDALLAEARLALESEGARWWPTQDDAELSLAIEAEQEARYQGDDWEGRIAEWLEQPMTIGTGQGRGALGDPRDGVTTGDVLKGALNVDPKDWTTSAQTRVGSALARLKWTVKRPREHGIQMRVYWRTEPVSHRDT